MHLRDGAQAVGVLQAVVDVFLDQLAVIQQAGDVAGSLRLFSVGLDRVVARVEGADGALQRLQGNRRCNIGRLCRLIGVVLRQGGDGGDRSGAVEHRQAFLALQRDWLHARLAQCGRTIHPLAAGNAGLAFADQHQCEMAFWAEVAHRALAGRERHHIVVEQAGDLLQQLDAYAGEALAEADQDHQLDGADLLAVQRFADRHRVGPDDVHLQGLRIFR
ncbi:hypothetical protein D9M68_321130 [compost metagenome]